MSLWDLSLKVGTTNSLTIAECLICKRLGEKQTMVFPPSVEGREGASNYQRHT